MTDATCSVIFNDGTHCPRPVQARGLCNPCYQWSRKHDWADPAQRALVLNHRQAADAFWHMTDSSAGPDACWPWTGTRTAAGYGRLTDSGTEIYAHRWILGHLRGAPLAQNEMACHHCDNPPCVNPSHLYVGDATTNMRDELDRGRHPNSGKTHCPYGHPYDQTNTYIRHDGSRDCRKCIKRRSRESMRRRRAAGRA